jgi:MFS family permease
MSFSFSESEPPYPKPLVAWYVVGVLAIAWTFGMLDRMIITLLTPSLKFNLALSDTQISFVQGMAFSLFFVLAGLPLGRLIDRANRRNVLIAGVLAWSLMTLCCGLASNYWQLVIARVGVGVGEACLAPAAFSILADYLQPERRGRGIGVLTACSGVGTAGSHLLVGSLLKAIGGKATVWVPFLGEIASWRLVFIVFALPGVFIALLLTTVREPPRRERQIGARASFLPYLKRNTWAFLALYGACALNGLVMLSFSVWEPAVFIRVHGMNPGDVGVMMGLVFLGASSVAGVVGGQVSDVLFKRFPLDGRLRVLVLLTPVMGLTVMLLIPNNMKVRIVAFGGVVTCFHMMYAVAYAALQDMTPNQMRGQMIALCTIIGNLVGMGLGPTAVALVTDYVFRDESMVAYAILTVCLPATLLSWLLVIVALRPVRRLRNEIIGNGQRSGPYWGSWRAYTCSRQSPGVDR